MRGESGEGEREGDRGVRGERCEVERGERGVRREGGT